ncbi:PBP1A family penicillin-binding protein [bacterium]|nr:PBP1A family penicillin-binding protein [bacterium]
MAKYTPSKRRKPSPRKRPVLRRGSLINKQLTPFQNILRIGIFSGIVTFALLMVFSIYIYINLPSLEDLVKPKYDLPTQIFDRNNELVTEFYTKRRVLIPFETIPKVMVNALLAIEDNRFYSHFGIDPIRMTKALIIDIIKMDFAQGASTLTQQTAKMFLLTSDKKIIRKLKEVFLALKIEATFSKDQILGLYLNKTYFGSGAYGIEAASQRYFSKNTSDLNLAEAALLAGLPQAPSSMAPTASITNAMIRRNLVLKMMDECGYITSEERIRTSAEPIILNLNKALDYDETAYYTEHVRRYIYDKYGQDQLYRGGLKVYTMMDLKMQIYAQNALHQGLIEHDKRQGFRGPQKNLLSEIDKDLGLYIYTEEKGWNTEAFDALDEESKTVAKELLKKKTRKATEKNQFVIGGNVLGVVTKVERDQVEVDLGKYQGNLRLTAMRWARKVNYNLDHWKERLRNFHDILRVSDVIELEILDYNHESKEFALVLSQNPIANGGILVVDPKSGQVMAMAGGFDFRESEFNRAIQSRRQTGSAFKPIAYSLALDNTFTTSSILDDTPIVGKDSAWKPSNYSKVFKGKVSLREALVHSKNMPSLNIAKELGTEAIIEHARKLGITADLPEDDLTLVLGSASITLKEMVSAFSIFANGGYLLEPVFIQKIEDKEGNVLEEYIRQEPVKVLSAETAFLMTSMLQDVVNRGSGRKAQAINRPSAGKTGTTNDYTDAWYIGFIPQLITGVYIGFDTNLQTLGAEETGSRAAAPIWVDFMKEATASMPILPFTQPEGITIVKINADSGLLDCGTGGNTIFEYYKAGTEPKQCHRMVAQTPGENDMEDRENDEENRKDVENGEENENNREKDAQEVEEL